MAVKRNTKSTKASAARVRGNGEAKSARSAKRVASSEAVAYRPEDHSLELYRTLFDLSSVAVGVVGRDAQLKAVNSKWAELSGYSKAELEGKMSWAQLVVPRDHARLRSYRDKRYRGDPNAPSHFECHIARKDGVERLVDVNVNLVPGTQHTIVSARDITDERAVQVELLRKVIRSEEDERNRLAGAIHDDLLQSVIAALCHVRAVEDKCEDPDDAERISRAGSLLEETVEQARRLIFELRPPLLEDLGLVPALRKLLDRLARDVRAETSFKAGRIPKLDPAVETALYRVVQESLSNIKKHANASSVSIGVRRRGNKVEVTIRDNGEGFDRLRPRNPLSPHYGLALMRERAVL